MIDRYKKIPIAVRAGIWLTLCSLIQKGISVITVPVFTRILSTEDYGLVSVFVSWTNIIILFTLTQNLIIIKSKKTLSSEPLYPALKKRKIEN